MNDSLLESVSNFRTSPIGPGPKTPPELDQTEVPLDYSSQGKRPRPSESPRQSPTEMDRAEVPLDDSSHLLGWLESQSNLKVTRRSERIKPSVDKAPAKPTRKKIKRPAKKNAKGEYQYLFTDDEENTTKEPKKKNKPAATTSSGHPGVGLRSIGPTLYSDSDSDIDPVN